MPHFKRGAAILLLFQQYKEHLNCIKNYEMRGVEDVEHVFHFCATAFTVIEGKEQNGDEREPLQNTERSLRKNGVMNGSYQQKHTHAENS